MTGTPLRVGIVGANAERGWALDAHLEALRALPGFEIAAVSARTQENADAASRVFGADAAFADSLEMARAPNLDVIAVTVKVPEHHKVVMAALEAGKHVYCEWPLGRDLAEAREMASAASSCQHTLIGTQGVFAPAVIAARKLVRDGAIGAPLRLRVFGSGGAWGSATTDVHAYLQDKSTGATFETIGAGHPLAVVEEIVGHYREVDARCTTFQKEVPVIGTDRTVDRTCADHMLVLGRHDSGCVSTLEVVGGRPKEKPPLFELEGETGWLRIRGTTPGISQIVPLELEASVPVEMPEPAVPDLSGPSANVASAWATLDRDIANGTRTVPAFDRAVELHRLLDAIDEASLTGQRQTFSTGS